jgi:hypothetical protein
MRRIKVTVTTAADGSATVLSPRLSGLIHSITYVKDDFADGVDFTITSNETGQNIWTQSDVNAGTTVYPRAPTHSQVGAAALYATDGTAVLDKIGLGNDQIKIVIAAGGNAKSGTFLFVVD